MHVLQLLQGHAEFAQQYLHFEFGVVHGVGQLGTPDFVGVFVTVACLYAAAQQVPHGLEGHIGDDHVNKARALGGGFGLETAEDDQVVFVDDLGKLGVDFGADVLEVDRGER